MSKQSSKWTMENKNTEKEYKRRWIHSPETLKNGHVIYHVKFLGKTEASQAKGIEVVKESIQKLTFSNQLKLSEGSKVPKVELSISIDGVKVQNTKSKVTLYQYPLHQISYCADDKADKKLFCFIAKEPNSNKHSSFVFASEKLAEEITLTIGQAFDMAYRRFLETSGKEIEMQHQVIALRKRIHDLEAENRMLKKEIEVVEKRKGSKKSTSEKTNEELGSKIPTNGVCPPPLNPPPPNNRLSRNLNCLEFNDQPKVEKLPSYFDDIKDLTNISNDNGFQSYDPFGMRRFSAFQPQNAFMKVPTEAERDLIEIRDAFQRGMSFGDGDFSSAGCFDVIAK
ncbi:hypothetical protein JTE90_015844 [Oedothorax gibbosus]|uniref:PID domain-containing protein n=1 Tax=Oedothorax gibbosus TaxID=931172 RepID=A0AAV6VVK7_9ARAC|nr:hypothetical protein JTE90_015844 [Oedothorax gibbosus]